MTDLDKIKELEDKIKSLEKSNTFLQNKLNDMEGGDMSLYHAVQRKMKELSKILNKYKLDEVDIDDAKNKTFDRLSGILEKCEKYALSANALGSRLGVGGGEDVVANTGATIRKITTPESMADNIGELAGRKSL